MSIYKKEASLEEMKREAISRMELLKLDTQTIQDFERDGSVNLSQQLGDQVFSSPPTMRSANGSSGLNRNMTAWFTTSSGQTALWPGNAGACCSYPLHRQTGAASGSTSRAPGWSMPMWSRRWRTVSVRSWRSHGTAV